MNPPRPPDIYKEKVTIGFKTSVYSGYKTYPGTVTETFGIGIFKHVVSEKGKYIHEN